MAAGEAEENGTFHADNVDVEDSQPQQTMTTPELPPRAVVEEHRIDHWCMVMSDAMVGSLSCTGSPLLAWTMHL